MTRISGADFSAQGIEKTPAADFEQSLGNQNMFIPARLPSFATPSLPAPKTLPTQTHYTAPQLYSRVEPIATSLQQSAKQLNRAKDGLMLLQAKQEAHQTYADKTPFPSEAFTRYTAQAHEAVSRAETALTDTYHLASQLHDDKQYPLVRTILNNDYEKNHTALEQLRGKLAAAIDTF